MFDQGNTVCQGWASSAHCYFVFVLVCLVVCLGIEEVFLSFLVKFIGWYAIHSNFNCNLKETGLKHEYCSYCICEKWRYSIKSSGERE